MKIVRGSFPKGEPGPTPQARRAGYERWVIDTHAAQIAAQREREGKEDASHMDPEYAAVMAQPNHDATMTRPSKAAAVAARCWQCVAGEDSEADEAQGWSRVTQCKTTACALWSVRPHQPAGEKVVRVRREDIKLKAQRIHPLDHGAKAVANPGNRPMAIKGYCHQCCGGRPNVSTMDEVSGCRVAQCALWVVRPVKAADDGDAESILNGHQTT
jgi:hypothetical protein